MEPWEVAAFYHERTKHHYNRYARSLGYLDWATQPDPFRRFSGAPPIPLRLAAATKLPAYDDLFELAQTAARPIDIESISDFLQFSLALSAWKEYRASRWALRINPSSGNLHPTEGYLVVGGVEGLVGTGGVYHYAPKEHALEQRTEIRPEVWQRLMGAFPAGTFVAGLSSIHWREAWKYGERAYRYCQHDAGHALAALSFSAAVQGWRVFMMDGISDEGIAALLGLDRAQDYIGAEREHADFLVAVVPRDDVRGRAAAGLPYDVITEVAAGRWTGMANALSGEHVTDWEIIDVAADACRKPATQPTPADAPDAAPLPAPNRRLSARQVIFQRRSAVDFDGRTGLAAEQFYLMLDRVLPRPGRVPWDALGGPPFVHLAIFVHLVTGLDPGLYILVRADAQRPGLAHSMNAGFLWQRPESCPRSLPFYVLRRGDVRSLATQVSCGQAIAGDGAFSCGMIAEFQSPLRRFGAWFYRRLFWETGLIGQVLYLEAEAAGVRATGIGCFFDDPMHDVLGLKDATYQSLYHFTVGGPVEDHRLTTLPPYPARS